MNRCKHYTMCESEKYEACNKERENSWCSIYNNFEREIKETKKIIKNLEEKLS